MLCLILTAGLLTLTLFFFRDERPDSCVPWALSGPYIELLFVLKMAISAAFAAWDVDSAFGTAETLLLLAADCTVIFLHVFATTYIHFAVQVVSIVSATFTGVFSLYLAFITVLFECSSM